MKIAVLSTLLHLLTDFANASPYGSLNRLEAYSLPAPVEEYSLPPPEERQRQSSLNATSSSSTTSHTSTSTSTSTRPSGSTTHTSLSSRTTSSATSSTRTSTLHTTSSTVHTSTSTTRSSSTRSSTTSRTTTHTSASATTTPNSITGGYTPHALTYSPYNNDTSCRAAENVLSDIRLIASAGVETVRIYATDCDSFYTVIPALQENGMKVIQGFYMDSDGVDSIDSQVSDFITWLQEDSSNADMVELLVVGNEAVIDGYATASDLLSKIASVKAQVRQYGYTGPVTTAEPPSTFIDYPFLCTSSTLDIVGINAHPYFDASGIPSGAGSFVLSQISITQSACDGKTVYVTETGYPHSGAANGGNVPNYANQGIALASIFQATQGHATFFTFTDDGWKSPGPYGVEQSWGIMGTGRDFL